MTDVRPPELQVAWAAGLFEGEGTITHGGRSQRPILALRMTDADIVHRFYEVVGGAAPPVRRRYEYEQRPNCKPVWGWTVGRQVDVVRILTMFLPYLGERRRARAEEALAFYIRAEAAKVPKTECRNGHPLTEVYITKKGARACRVCRRNGRRRYEAKRLARTR